jgi:hypothetical protein
MTLKQMDAENKLVEEKFLVVKELMNYLHEAQFDRTTLTSEMLRDLQKKISVMLLNDF